MNLPNKLSIARVIMTPVFLAAFFINFKGHWLAAFALFAIASITDILDGQIARRKGIVTPFGKFLDPLADKVLVSSALIAFVSLGLANPLVALIVVVRDYLISAVRLLAVSSDGKVIAANIWGKIKTSLSMVFISTVLLALHFAENMGEEAIELVVRCSNWAMWLLAAITALSGVVYMVQNKEILEELK
ncbi:MAG: CDP-diacylglycerol--glycerol-3-phosphate 3-phosphatidyltransferase [Oscillospiraceae bacterium]|nr:CDP-diacylglycerol--glycerol-3-phosphate 3-phosphatidyltransferase [Oscillospiraceae bacterium]